jgi:membrane protein DedA with SNARE-associated domain
MLEQAVTTLHHLPNEKVYLLLFIISVMENVFPPIPGDTTVVFGAYLAGIGKLDILTVFFLTTLGSTGGFLILFLIGKYYGREFFLSKNFRFFPKESIFKVEKWFHHYGVGLILANRFLSGARSVISLIAGISNMNISTTIVAALISSILWNALLLSGGYFIGNNWQMVVTLVKSYNQLLVIAMIVSLLLYFWKKRKRNAHRG